MGRRDDLAASALLVGYIVAGVAQAVSNPFRVLRRGGYYAKEIADAERRMAERNAVNARARARHVAVTATPDRAPP